MGTLITAAIAAVILTAMIWASVRAKPLGGMRYRWATFTGIYDAFTALAFFYINYWRFPNLRLLGLAVSCCAGISSYGILHRRKYGVVMYTVESSLIVVFLIISAGLNLRTIANLVLPISVSVVTLVYFRKRWNLLASQPLAMKGIVHPEAEIENSK